MTDLQTVISLFESCAGLETSLPQKTHLKILCKGHAAAARGWRLLAIGEGDEAEIREALRQATIPLMGNQKRPRGPGKKLSLCEPDEIVLERYFHRDPLDLTLRHFVEAAFDEGMYVGFKAGSIEVHVNRLQRYLDRRQA